MINFLFIYAYLIFLSIVDLKTMHLNKWQILGLVILCMPIMTIDNMIIAMFVFVALILLNKFIPNSLGLADIKIITILTCVIGYYIIPSILLASLLGIIIIKLPKQNNKNILPFIPLITLGVIVCQNSVNLMII